MAVGSQAREGSLGRQFSNNMKSKNTYHKEANNLPTVKSMNTISLCLCTTTRFGPDFHTLVFGRLVHVL